MDKTYFGYYTVLVGYFKMTKCSGLDGIKTSLNVSFPIKPKNYTKKKVDAYFYVFE